MPFRYMPIMLIFWWTQPPGRAPEDIHQSPRILLCLQILPIKDIHKLLELPPLYLTTCKVSALILQILCTATGRFSGETMYLCPVAEILHVHFSSFIRIKSSDGICWNRWYKHKFLSAVHYFYIILSLSHTNKSRFV